jgi:hypothetical protein
MSLTLFTGIAELDQEIFSNINDIVSLRNLYVTSKSLRNYMENTLVMSNIKKRLKMSYKIDLFMCFSFDAIINEILPIHYVRTMGNHAFCAFLLRQNKFNLIEKFFNKRKNSSPTAYEFTIPGSILPRYALPSPYGLSSPCGLSSPLCITYNGHRVDYSFNKEKTYYGLVKHLAKNELLAEMKTLIHHINFTQRMAKRLCEELSGHSQYLDMKQFTENGIQSRGKSEVTLTHNILEYLINLFSSLLDDNCLIHCVADSPNIIVHKILRNNSEWSQLYPIIKNKFMCSEDLQTAVCLLGAYPELYVDETIIEHVVSIYRTNYGKPSSFGYCCRTNMNTWFYYVSTFLQQSRINNNILNYWHVHHPDKHFWYDKLAQEVVTRLALHDKTLYDKKCNIINFIQKNPNCSPINVFKMWSSFEDKRKLTAIIQQYQKQLPDRKHQQTSAKYRQLNYNPLTKYKQSQCNQPTSHKHQCRNYRK